MEYAIMNCPTLNVESNHRQIPLTQGRNAIVDEADYIWLMQWKWHYHNRGYAARTQQIGRINGKQKNKTILMHRVIMGTPDGLDTDHRDSNKLNNRRSNLRVCTVSQNQRNRKTKTGKRTIYKGVHWDGLREKWRAIITIHGRQISIGRYDSELEAAQAYNKAARSLHGSFARLNAVA